MNTILNGLITDKPIKLLTSVKGFSVQNYGEINNISISKIVELVDKLDVIYTRLGIDNFRNKYTLIYAKRGLPHIFKIFNEKEEVIATINMHKDNSIEVNCKKFNFHAKNITDLRNNYSVDYLNNDLTWHINN